MKTHSLILLIGFFGIHQISNAADQKAKDIQAIKSLCGCFEIDFNYTETFSPDTNYVFHEDHHTKASAEYAFIVEESPTKIVIQHLLIIGNGTIIKHWREDWLYENTEFYEFNKDLSWTYVSRKKSDVIGTWTQKVYQVDDSPRYEGFATWVHVDGRHFWENRADSPLPRREYSHRSDYNVLSRGNRVELTSYGWMHEQDNIKIIRDDSGDKELVREKGYNRYQLQDLSKCQAAIDWWTKYAAYWAVVRGEWDALFKMRSNLEIALKMDEKMLWEELFATAETAITTGQFSEQTVRENVSVIMNKFTKK